MSAKRVSGCLVLGIAVQMVLAVSAMAQVDKKQAVEDWKRMDELCGEYQQTFMSESDAKKKGAAFKEEWEAWKKKFEPAWADFKKKYGKDHTAVGEAFKGIDKPQGVSMDAWQEAAVANGVNIAEVEKKFADWAVAWGDDAYRIATHSPGETLDVLERKMIRAEDAVRYYKLAKTWDAKRDCAEQISKAEEVVKEVKPAWKKALAEKKWPGHRGEFTGPGKPDELAAAALEFLRKNPNWTKPEYDDEHTPLAACVTGKGWEVWKKAPLTEQPTQYSIELLVAFSGKADPELVYCYHMVFYTKEEAGVKPELPFNFANSKQYACFRMLKSNVSTK